MTIAAAYLTSEGVVLGADSTSSVSNGNDVVQLFSYGQKVFEVGEDARLCICTWGMGTLGAVSHRTLVARLAGAIDKDNTTVREAAETFVKLVTEALVVLPTRQFVGYFVGAAIRSLVLRSVFS